MHLGCPRRGLCDVVGKIGLRSECSLQGCSRLHQASLGAVRWEATAANRAPAWASKPDGLAASDRAVRRLMRVRQLMRGAASCRVTEPDLRLAGEAFGNLERDCAALVPRSAGSHHRALGCLGPIVELRARRRVVCRRLAEIRSRYGEDGSALRPSRRGELRMG